MGSRAEGRKYLSINCGFKECKIMGFGHVKDKFSFFDLERYQIQSVMHFQLIGNGTGTDFNKRKNYT